MAGPEDLSGPDQTMRYQSCLFQDLPGWADDDHQLALSAFQKSFAFLRKSYPKLPEPELNGLGSACAYFETHFVPQRVVHARGNGLFTGYFEPVLRGSRVKTDRFSIPLMNRPDDLVTLVDDSLRGAEGDALTHGKQGVDGNISPYQTRAEIEAGGLSGRGLEFVYLSDPIDTFFLHVQGSGLIELEDGYCIRVGYAAKNGHRYTSIGQTLIEEGHFTPDTISLEALGMWLREDLERGRRVMQRNESYIFFDELGDANAVGPVGVNGISLTPGRSLAVDAGQHQIGLPVFIDVPGLEGGQRRLMIAQDVGSAIRGAERGDIYYGTGSEAGQRAGLTKHWGNMFVLRPNSPYRAGVDAVL